MGTVYANERGLPMFRRGYERQQHIRECFRVPVNEEGQPWPSPRTKSVLAARHYALPGPYQMLCWRRLSRDTKGGEDFSLAYCFRYGENDGGANGGSDDTLVGEHADVSLVVVEPVSRVAGLEVYDLCLKRWVCVEAVCVPGKELVVFVGRALSRTSGLPALQTPRRQIW